MVFCPYNPKRLDCLPHYLVFDLNTRQVWPSHWFKFDLLITGLELAQTTFAGTVHYGIFCKKTVISKGSKLGPFRGKQVNTSEIKTNDDNSFMWEVSFDLLIEVFSSRTILSVEVYGISFYR